MKRGTPHILKEVDMVPREFILLTLGEETVHLLFAIVLASEALASCDLGPISCSSYMIVRCHDGFDRYHQLKFINVSSIIALITPFDLARAEWILAGQPSL